MQALSRQLADDLQARFPGLPAHEPIPTPRPNPPDAAYAAALGALRGTVAPALTPENVVRPVVFQREPVAPRMRARPEVAAAIDTVVKAAEVLRAAEQDAEEKTQRALNLAFRTITQLEKAEGQLRAAHGRIEELGQNAETARAASARLVAAETALAASHERVRGFEDHVAHLEAALAAAETRAEAADDRAQAAELLASQAEADVRYLADKVSEVLGVRG